MTNGRAGGWVRGLIHLHSTYSDGKSSIRGLSGLARDVYGYEYLVFTDHADCLDRARFSQYADECRDISGPDFVVIPGLEFSTVWQAGAQDRSQAHTVAFAADPGVLQELLPLRQARDVVATWPPEAGAPPATRRLRQRLADVGSLAAAAHQFSYSKASAGHSLRTGPLDYRYDLSSLLADDGLDFYYGNPIEVNHEAEDLALYTGMQARWVAGRTQGGDENPPWAYAGSDFHAGLWQRWVARHRDSWRGSILGLPSRIAANWDPWRQFVTWLDRYLSPGYEQLRRVTWLCIDGDLSAETVLDAIAHRRTCATRGRGNTINWLNITPTPGTSESGPVKAKVPEVSLYAQFERPTTRPLFAGLYRDGVEITGFSQSFSENRTSLWLNWKDEDAGPGVHSYVIAISGKLVTSPILIEKA